MAWSFVGNVPSDTTLPSTTILARQLPYRLATPLIPEVFRFLKLLLVVEHVKLVEDSSIYRLMYFDPHDRLQIVATLLIKPR
jgi:hypothetical protein